MPTPLRQAPRSSARTMPARTLKQRSVALIFALATIKRGVPPRPASRAVGAPPLLPARRRAAARLAVGSAQLRCALIAATVEEGAARPAAIVHARVSRRAGPRRIVAAGDAAVGE